jgi:hypothetical protein
MLLLAKKYEDGDQRQREFCEQNGIKESILNYWLSIYRKKNLPISETPQIVPVTIKSESSGQIKIVTSQGVQIHIPI